MTDHALQFLFDKSINKEDKSSFVGVIQRNGGSVLKFICEQIVPTSLNMQ